MKSNTQQLALAEKHLGEGGAKFRKFCGMSSGPYCNAFVCYVFNEAGNASLFYGGKKVTYCPTSIKWCQNNLAQIPIYLALPSDVIYFDWEPNGRPNHIGFVRARKSDQEIYTIEGNTSKTNSNGRVVATGVVAYKTRQIYGRQNGKKVQYIQAVFRPHFKATWKDAPLVVDGYFGYNSIAMLQKALKLTPDGILGKGTVKALQKRAGVLQDGSWGPATSKAVQKMIGTTVDGQFGPKSVKALQTWINKQNGVKATPAKATPAKTTASAQDKAVAWAKKIAADNSYKYVAQTKSDSPANHCAICKKVASGSKYHGFNCIRFVGAAYYHGAGVPIKSADHKLVTTEMANKMLRASTIASALKLWTDRNGAGWTLIKNGNKKIPVSMLKKGDVLICYDKEGSSATYKHMAIYDGDGMISDAANASAGIVTRKYTDLSRKCLIAMRYTK